LKKVQFAEPIITCRQFTDGYRRVQKLHGFEGPQSIRKTTFASARAFSQPSRRNVAQSLATPVTRAIKRIGAIQISHPQPSQVGDLATGEYRMSRTVDSFSFTQNPYFRQPQTFRVSTVYKTKANKVRLVDPGETDGSKPRGRPDWFEWSKADDVPCLDPGKYADWITPKFSDIPKGSRLTDERIKGLIIGDLWPKEKELFIEVLYN
jgi:hypothetical protein